MKLSTPSDTYTFQDTLKAGENQYFIGIQEIDIKANTFTDEYQRYLLYCDQLKIEHNFDMNGNTCKLLKSFPMTSGLLKSGYVDNIQYKRLICQFTFSLKDENGNPITLSTKIVIILALKSVPLNG